MDTRSTIYLILTIVFIFLSFFFSLVETAYSCLNKYRIKAMAMDKNRRAIVVSKIIDKFDVTLSSVLVGNNICAVLLSIVSAYLFGKFINLDQSIVSIISSVVITIIVYIFGETLPKHIAKKIPNKVALKTAYILVFFIIIFLPISLILVGISSLLNLIFKNNKEADLTEDDFSSVIENNEEKGALEENETDIIQNSLDFTETTVSEVLTPVDKIYAIDIKGMNINKLAKMVANTNYSRIPLYYSDINRIVGVLIVKTFLARYLQDKNLDLKSIISKPYIITPSIMIDDLIDGFRTTHTQIAFVFKDKKLLGMVTMDDVLEELVGPIKDSDSGVSYVN